MSGVNAADTATQAAQSALTVADFPPSIIVGGLAPVGAPRARVTSGGRRLAARPPL